MTRRFLVDEKHRRFLIDEWDNSDEYHVRLLREGDYVGQAKCPYVGRDTWAGGELFITDGAPDSLELLARRGTTLNRDANDPCHFSISQASQIQNGINYRSNGLGTKLLQFVIEQARSHGVRHIYGSVVQRDIDQSPRLLDWYQRHGFVLCSTCPGLLINDAVAHIHLYLG